VRFVAGYGAASTVPAPIKAAMKLLMATGGTNREAAALIRASAGHPAARRRCRCCGRSRRLRWAPRENGNGCDREAGPRQHGQGGHTITRALRAVVNAHERPLTGAEALRAAQVTAVLTSVWEIWFRSDIAVKDRILDGRGDRDRNLLRPDRDARRAVSGPAARSRRDGRSCSRFSPAHTVSAWFGAFRVIVPVMHVEPELREGYPTARGKRGSRRTPVLRIDGRRVSESAFFAAAGGRHI